MGADVKRFPGSRLNAIRFYPLGSLLLDLLIPASLKKLRGQHKAMAVAKAEKRIETGVMSDRGDFMTYILKHNDEKGMQLEEIRETAGLLIIAGSETTATALSGFCYHLAQNPAAYERAAQEVLAQYKSDADISLLTVMSTPYLEACIEEAMRLFPPVPSALHRIVPASGATIHGQFVPGGVGVICPSTREARCADAIQTSVGCPQWSMYRSSRNWAYPDEFHPGVRPNGDEALLPRY